MKNLVFILLFINVFCPAQGFTSEKLGFEHKSIIRDKLGTINFYLSLDSINAKKPLIVYLDGSGSFPLFQKFPEGLASTVVLDYQELSKEYRILLISKPGIPFVDNVESDEYGYPIYAEPKEYKENLSLDWRVNSANEVINYLTNQNMIDSSRIVVLGFSEGAQVAPKLASMNSKITHLMLFGGNGLNQLLDPIVNARLKAYSGQISEEEGQIEVDSLFSIYKNIYNDPNATDKEWWGHTYKRWSSFTNNDPFQYLIKLNIPIYFANGSMDENSVISADYIQLEFIKNRKGNLTYKTYPNYDHQFNHIIIENGEFVDAIPMIDNVMKEAFNWLNEEK